jgi:hypothetical protein
MQNQNQNQNQAFLKNSTVLQNSVSLNNNNIANIVQLFRQITYLKV